MDFQPTTDLKEFMMNLLTDEKVNRFQEVVKYRTKHVTVVLEDIFQGHNTNAVLRSCDCFGIQDVHIIENRYEFEVVDDISMGSAKWLNLYRHRESENNTHTCLKNLKDQGYTIIGTSPHENNITLEKLDLSQKVAFVIGTEKEGLSNAALKECDGFLKIPMVGFTESLNLSVCAAIILQHVTHRLHESTISWQLSEEEETSLLIDWCFRVTGRKEMLLEYFREHRS